jgi:hypothetical protein
MYALLVDQQSAAHGTLTERLTMPTVRAICAHCSRPITYSATRMEWWHNDTEAAFVMAGIAPCKMPQPRSEVGAITRDDD